MQSTPQTIGEGTRILHFLVDTILVIILSFAFYKWYNFYVFFWGYPPIRYGLFFFIVYWFYIFLFEIFFLRTPAKWITKTKVQSWTGKRPGLLQFLIRASIRTTLISMFGLAWNDKPFHDTFSKTGLVAVNESIDS